MRLADSAVAFARSAIRNSRPGASDKHINVLYSFAVIPTVRTRSLSSRRGKDKTIRISARQKISSVAFSGSTLATQQGYLLGQAPICTSAHIFASDWAPRRVIHRYQVAADWAEHEMTLKPGSMTALRGQDAAKRGREVLAKALSGRPSIDPDAKPGQHARVRQVRVSTEVDARIEVLAADRHVKASDIIREAPAAYLAVEVSRGGKAASPTQRSRAVVPTKASRVRNPAKAVPPDAAKRVSVSAKTARKPSGIAAKRPAKTA